MLLCGTYLGNCSNQPIKVSYAYVHALTNGTLKYNILLHSFYMMIRLIRNKHTQNTLNEKFWWGKWLVTLSLPKAYLYCLAFLRWRARAPSSIMAMAAAPPIPPLVDAAVPSACFLASFSALFWARSLASSFFTICSS